MGEADLLAQIALSKTLLAEVPYSDRVTRHAAHARADRRPRRGDRRCSSRTPHPLGDVLSVDGEHRGAAELLPQQRAAPVHRVGVDRVLLPATTGACRAQPVLRLGRAMYPFLQAELFLPWDEDGFAERIDRTIDVFIREGLLQQVGDDDGGILARNAGPERRGVPPARDRRIRCSRRSSATTSRSRCWPRTARGTLGAGELESLCQLAAQRLSLLYAPAAPEFFDKSLFRSFIQKLRELRLVWPTRTASWCSTSAWTAGRKDAKVILGRELRHTIEKISPEAVEAGGWRRPRGMTDQAGSSGISADSSLAMLSFSCSLRFFRRLTASSSASMSGLQARDRDVEVAMLQPQRRHALGDAGEFDGIGRRVHPRA